MDHTWGTLDQILVECIGMGFVGPRGCGKNRDTQSVLPSPSTIQQTCRECIGCLLQPSNQTSSTVEPLLRDYHAYCLACIYGLEM